MTSLDKFTDSVKEEGVAAFALALQLVGEDLAVVSCNAGQLSKKDLYRLAQVAARAIEKSADQ